MAKFMIEFQDSGVSETLELMEFMDADRAVEESVTTARELIADGARQGIDRSGWLCIIRTEEREEVARFAFQAVLAKGKPLQ